MSIPELEPSAYELHFESLDGAHGACAFPCDALGHVDMDQLGESVLTRYLYARAVIGREYRLPSVRRKAGH